MNNAYAMSISASSFEARKNSQASMITAGFAGLLLLLMFMLKWTITAVEPPPVEEGILVELNIPDEPPPIPEKAGNSGGGGGETVEAPGKPGIAQASPPDPGTKDDARDIDEDPKEHTTPAILKPRDPKPNAPKINENKAPIKVPPKVDPTPPAPPKPKAVLGHNTTGQNPNGGNETATQYPKTGGTGTGYTGAGNTKGDGGGDGGGFGGGRGTGSGPYVSKGDRSIIGSYSFEGDLDKAKIYADIRVSPDGTGQFVQFARGSTSQNSAYRTAIEQYLRRMKFNKSDHESTVTVVFNFKVNG